MRATKISPKKKKVSSSSSSSLIPALGEVHQPSEDFRDYCYLIYGEKSMGKTTLLSQMSENGVVCMFEDRTNLPIRMVNLPSKTVDELDSGGADPWANFKKVIEEALDNPDVDLIGVDTADMAYQACLNHICFTEGIRHPGEVNDFGTTWNLVSEEFRSTMEKIRKSRLCLVLTSHCTIERMELNTASKDELKKYTVYSPSCSKQPTQYIRQSCDYAFFYGKHGRCRSLHFRWEDNIWTACGNDSHFLDEDGDPISVLHIPSKDIAGKAFRSAFANKPVTPVLKTWDNSYEVEEDEPEETLPSRKIPRKPSKRD